MYDLVVILEMFEKYGFIVSKKASNLVKIIRKMSKFAECKLSKKDSPE